MLQEIAPIIMKDKPRMVWVTWKNTREENKRINVSIQSFVKGRAFPKASQTLVTSREIKGFDGRVIKFHCNDKQTTDIYIGSRHSEEVQKHFKNMMKQSKSERKKMIDKYANHSKDVITPEVKKKRFNRLNNKVHQLYRKNKIERFKVKHKQGEIEVIFPKTSENVPNKYVFGLNYILAQEGKGKELQEKLISEFTVRGDSIWKLRHKMAIHEMGNYFNDVLSAYDLRKR